MNVDFQTALSTLPDSVQTFFKCEFNEKKVQSRITKSQWENLLNDSKLSDKELKLCLLPLAASYSLSPVSEFKVGAIVEAYSGNIYFGANMEFHAVSMGNAVHAEQSAISNAWSQGETGIRSIAINYSPCGHCRQFMNELPNASDIVIFLPEQEAKPLSYYLPASFGPLDLGQKIGLMEKTTPSLVKEGETALISSAIRAAALSHAPYSNNLAGVALKTKQGEVYTGQYAENAAFNPSLPPLQVALVQLNMAGDSIENINEACLVEAQGGKISYLGECQLVLEQINPDIIFEYVVIDSH